MNVYKIVSNFFKKEIKFQIINIDIRDLKFTYLNSRFKKKGILSSYPSMVSLSNSEINAGYMLTLINEESFHDLYEIFLIPLNINIKNQRLDNTEKYINNGSISFLRVQKDFGGYLIGLVTDDVLLLNQIMQAKLDVVPPWIATNLTPKDFIFSQGKEEFYWNTFWLRFYESMAEQDLKQYLSQYDIPLEWEEYFEISSSK